MARADERWRTEVGQRLLKPWQISAGFLHSSAAPRSRKAW